MPILISQAGAIAREDLHQLGPVQLPLSSPAAQLIGHKYLNDSPGIDSMGIWECSPGRWRRTIMEEEFAHFISGRARFTPDGREPIEIRGGDTVFFPKNSAGIWEIEETVRKVYVIIDRPGFAKRWKMWAKRVLEAYGLKRPSPQAARLPASPARHWGLAEFPANPAPHQIP